MKDQFKQRLRDYEAGKLSPEETAELEQELARLEAYQEHLDEALAEGGNKKEPEAAGSLRLNPKREKQLMKRAKWKMRSWNVGTVFGIVVLLLFVNSIFTAIYYDAGEPARRDMLKDAIDSAIAVTHPNIMTNGSNSSTGALLGMKFEGNLRKKVGNEYVYAGEYTTKLLLNKLNTYKIKWADPDQNNNNFFYLPDAKLGEGSSDNAWKRLEKLPEGTVATANISLDRLYTTDDVLQLFANGELEPLWLAVYYEPIQSEFVTHDLLGFPTTPLWHYGDGVTTYQDKNKRFGLFTTYSSSKTQYPAVRTDGDGELRNANFIATLELMQKYKGITKMIAPFIDIEQALAYTKENGISIYGVVVTGPTKELLKLKDERYVHHIAIKDAELWN